MPFVPKISVRARLTLGVLLAVLGSWVLSNAASTYVVYQRIAALRGEMLADPQRYPYPVPPPEFHLMDLLLGPRPALRAPGPRQAGPNGPPPEGEVVPRPPMPGQPGPVGPPYG